MWAFQYKHGDKPLAGFTIQRAAGRGGFGEVYYAVSDGGREVALKAVTGYEQIELRGIGQCMNLKNPHLVTIFDVKYNDQGRPFVIMEFVAGPSLRQLLDESPGGLGAQKAAFFLREIGKGLTFLHDCGIVHRDLKPGNIFYENGYVKIGDYGLSKAMEPTQHSGQTITVGTVHYMAPEIGGGRYDKSIDIYAMGAVLYELLTGQPPFLGASAGEILMKHVSAEPDLTGVEEPFRTVIRKAMAKNPADRYQSVQEMVEAVFGAEHIQQSVSCFSPDALSMIAQRVAQRVAVGGGSVTPPPIPPGGGVATAQGPRAGDRLGHVFDRVGDRIGAIGNRVADLGVHALPQRARRDPATPGDPPEEYGDAMCDPLSKRQRRVLALIMLLVMSAAAATLSPLSGRDGPFVSFWAGLLGAAGATLGLLVAGHRILPQMTSESGFLRRLASGGTAAGLLMLFGIPVFGGVNGHEQEVLALTAVGAFIALFLAYPPDLSLSRDERVGFGPAIGAAAFGFLAWIFTQGNFGLLVAIVSGSHLLAQVLSPWDPFAARRRMGLSTDSSGAPAPRPAPGDSPWPHPAHGGDAPTMAWPPAAPAAAPAAVPAEAARAARENAVAWADYAGDVAAGNAPTSAPPPPLPPLPGGYKPVPVLVRYLWVAAAVLLIPTGIVMLVVGADHRGPRDEFVMIAGGGVGALALACLALVKMWQSTYRTKWRYVGRYFLAWLCCQAFVFAAFSLASVRLRNEELALSIFVMILSLLMIPVVVFLRFTPAAPASPAAPTTPPPAPPAPPAPPTSTDRRAARGAARAARRQRRADWRDAAAWRVHGPPVHVRLFRAARDLFVGGSLATLLLVAATAGTFIALDVPGMLAAGIPDPSIPRDLTQSFGFSRWPQFMRGVANFAAWGALLAAAVVLIVARRGTYGLHMLRGVAGVALFSLGLLFLAQSLRRSEWAAAPAHNVLAIDVRQMLTDEAIAESARAAAAAGVEHPLPPHPLPPPAPYHADQDAERVAAAVERYLEHAHGGLLAIAMVTTLLSLVLICWPARRRPPEPFDLPRPDAAPATAPQHA